MVIGHLPAGYLVSDRLDAWVGHDRGGLPRWLLIGVGLFASVFPDVDIPWFFLVDGGVGNHHRYWTHLPVFWLGLAVAWQAMAWLLRSRGLALIGLLVGVGGFSHLVLDSITGRIPWLYPLSDRPFYLINVPLRYDFWALNFVLHPTILLDLLVLAAAAAVFLRNLRGEGTSRAPAARRASWRAEPAPVPVVETDQRER